MNKASNVKLSLRKLLTAMMAVGPLAILPAPLWAALPTSSSFTVQNGTASVTQTGSTVATITTSDRAVLQWGATNFNIASGEGYNFQMPAGGAVLNRVGNSTATDVATIAGQLDSNGKVFVLANGTIQVSGGASITTSGGLYLSTLPEENGAFLATGDLLYVSSGTPGNINIGGSIVAGVWTANATPVSISGNLTAVGGGINHAMSSVTGDMVLRSVNSGTAMSLANSGAMSVGGNLTVTTNAGAITQAAGGNITVGNTTALSQIASFSTGGGNVAISLNGTLSNTNDFQVIKVNAGTGAGGNVDIREGSNIVIGDSVVGGNLFVAASGNSAKTDGQTGIGTNGAVVVTGNADYNIGAAAIAGGAGALAGTARTSINIANNSSVGGSLLGNITNNSSFTFNGTGNITTGAITATAPTAAGGRATGVTIITPNALTVNGLIATSGNGTDAGGAISLRGGTIAQTATGILNAGTGTSGAVASAGSVTLNATAGNITVGTILANRTVTLNASVGSISQLAGTTITTQNTSGLTNVYRASGSIVLDNANVFEPANIHQFTAASANITNTKAMVLGTTNVTGNLNMVTSVAGGSVTLGTGLGTAAQNITVGGTLGVNVAGIASTITDNDYTAFNIFGGVSLTTAGGGVTLDAAKVNSSLAPSVRLGAVSVNAPGAAIALSESTTLNLGTITGATLTANSVTGGIVDSGNITVTTANLVANGNNTITLDSTANSITNLNIAGATQASVTVNAATTVGGSAGSLTGNLSVTNTSAGALVVNGVSVTGGLTLTSSGTTDFNTATSSVTGDLVVNSAGAVNQTAGVTVTGNATLQGAGVVNLNGANDFNSVILANSAAVTVNDINNLTVSGTSTGSLTAKAGGTGATLANTWNLSIGNLSVAGLTATAENGGGGRSGSITQVAGTSIHSEGATSFTTRDGNIVVANAGNSFGGVTIKVNDKNQSNTVTVTEDGTMRLLGHDNRGTTTLTSRTGSIIEDANVNVSIINNGTLSLNAAAGSVLIGSTTKATGFTTTGNVVTANINAMGSAAVYSSNNLALGTVTAASLTATANNGNLTQSGVLKVYGSANFSATGGNLTLENAANNFGRVSLTAGTASRNISITESGTLNLGSVTMPASSTGNFTATSVNGDIIDTGLANLRPGGTTAAAGTGIVTLTATKGNIVLDDPTTDFPTTGGVVFNAMNVTLSPLGNAAIYLGSTGSTSVATGNLVVTSAIGNIASNGNISVTGDAFFQAGNGNITLAQSGNKFGTVKFTGNQVAIVESDDMGIVTGSSAIGTSQLSSGGNLSVVNKGGTINFNNTVFLSATGNITLPKVVQAVGTITVNAAGTKDLSVLSKSGDLNNKDPNNLGTGTYLPPLP